MNENKDSICYSRWVATLSQGMGKRKQRNSPPIGVVLACSDGECECKFLLIFSDYKFQTMSFELFVAAWFGCSEMLKNYYHIHPIWKSIQVAKEEKCHNLVSSLSQVPRGQRSKGRGTEKVTAPQDAGMLHIALHIYPLTLKIQHISLCLAIAQHSPIGSKCIILILLMIWIYNCQTNNHHTGSFTKMWPWNESRSQLDFAAHLRKPRNVRTKRAAEPSDSEVTCESSLRSCRQSRRLKCSTTFVQKWEKLDSEKFEVYMESVWRRFTEDRKNVFTYLDSLWFSLYAKEPLKQRGHWFLLIFCHFGESPQSTTKRRCMLLLDSLQKANSKQLEPGIRRFVFDIFKIEERPEKKELISKIPLLIPKVPQQKYGEECGLFVLYYINLFLEMAPGNFSFSMGYPHFMKEDWFTHEEVESFAKGLDSMNETSAHSD
ncbi:hypothetical protein Sango_0210500 [Sesamum angolense]|uniref:Ubiquitin-like protease family profile domain-containing protein n=1 Tax=Sesamum angolense TaxID=2727404 RepID=A0AAE1XG72_9LAMI|nr:hypothetical protein Sango_0210500 [Sesamum angolense]